jgi:hypothetical protein
MLAVICLLLIERTLRGRDQQAQHKCGERADQARCHFYSVPGVRMQMRFRQQWSDKHANESTAEDQREHKERDQ